MIMTGMLFKFVMISFVCRLNKKSHSVAGKSMCFIGSFMLFQIIHRSGINC